MVQVYLSTLKVERTKSSRPGPKIFKKCLTNSVEYAIIDLSKERKKQTMKKIRICVALKNGTVMHGQSVKKNCLPLFEGHISKLWETLTTDKQVIPEGSVKIIRFKEFMFTTKDFAGVWIEEV